MKLTDIRIEQFRQFRQALALEGLEDGINLISGPNEIGKSTVAQAIRAAFFERYVTSTASVYQPWGDSAAAPSVDLTFEVDGERWQLAKRFLKRKRCDLSIGTTTLSNDEAEARLANLMGFNVAAAGASKEKDWGIPGLLWIEQGSGQAIDGSVANAQSHLEAALESLVGDIASAGGDDIIHAVASQRGELLTPGGKPRNDYLKTIQQVEDLAQKAEGFAPRVARYQESVDRLGELQQVHQITQRDRPWENLREKADAARTQLAEIGRLQQEQNSDEQALATHRTLLTQLATRQAEAEQLSEQLQQRERDRGIVQTELTALEEKTEGLERTLQQAREAYQSARGVLQQARKAELHQSLQQARAEANEQASKLRKVQQDVEKLREQEAAARESSQNNRIDEAILDDLSTACSEHDQLRIRLETVATRLKFQLVDGVTLRLHEDILSGEGEVLLTEAAVLDVPGLGRLDIEPGGNDLGTLQREYQQQQDSIDALLSSLNVPSLAIAQERAENQRKAQAELTRIKELLHVTAPDGIEALATELDTALRQAAEAAERLEGMEAPNTDLPSLDTAQSMLDSTEILQSEAEQVLQSHQHQLAIVRDRLESAEKEWQRLHEQLHSEKRHEELRQLAAELTETQTAASTLETAIAERQLRINDANPTLVKQDIERLSASATSQENMHREREREIHGLQVYLQSAEALELADQQVECETELAYAQRRLADFERRAQALKLLYTLLQEGRQKLTRRLQAPLQKHLDHYLAMLFPNSSLQVDEALKPDLFQRDGETGKLSELSFGAREQMGLISRLAYADLLQEAGRPTLIMLDDSLVHSDAKRRDTIKRALYDAAQRHQILFFTCHPENWDDLGAKTWDLAALKADRPA